MPLNGTTGQIVETRRNGSKELWIEWKIGDFFSLSDEVSTWYNSPLFGFSDGCWLLCLYPNFISECMGFYLYRRDSGPPKTIHYTVGIRGSCGVEKEVAAEREFSEDVRGYGTPRFCLRSELKEHEFRLMPNNELTITCNLKNVGPSTAIGLEELQKSFQNMLRSGDDSDVIIKVQGKEFPVHGAILRARSPVFQAMFAHDMVEKQRGVVTMEDCDTETFPDFLEHVYTGSVEMISTKNVASLYTTSDKYDLETLKKECTLFMKRDLNVACFCDVMTLAMKHGEKELIERATDFFCNHTLEIVKTVEWEIFLKENTTVGNELLIKLLTK